MITPLLIRNMLLQPHQFVSNVMIATNQWRTATPAQTTLCDECLKAHKKVKALRDHKTVNITDGKALDIEPQAKKSYSCSVHPEEPLKLYCKSCKSLACLLCFVGLHNGHEIGSIDGKTRQEVTQSINDLMKATNSNLNKFNDSLKYVSAVKKEKAEAPIPLKAQVDKKVDSLIQQLEARRKELHKEIDDACTKDFKELWAQKEYHEAAITSMEGALSQKSSSLQGRHGATGPLCTSYLQTERAEPAKMG